MDAFCGNSFPAVEEGQSGVGKKPLYGIGEKVAQKYGNSFDREGTEAYFKEQMKFKIIKIRICA